MFKVLEDLIIALKLVQPDNHDTSSSSGDNNNRNNSATEMSPSTAATGNGNTDDEAASGKNRYLFFVHQSAINHIRITNVQIAEQF